MQHFVHKSGWHDVLDRTLLGTTYYEILPVVIVERHQNGLLATFCGAAIHVDNIYYTYTLSSFLLVLLETVYRVYLTNIIIFFTCFIHC
jgi:hypothetical protein